MTQTQEVTRQPAGVIAKLAGRFDMNPAAFEQTLVRTIFPDKGRTATKEEVAALCIVSMEYGLNPLTRQIYAFPSKAGGIVPVISVDGWYALANRDSKFDGITFAFTYREGDAEQNVPRSCVATLYRKDRAHPIVVEEHYSECYRDTGPWNGQPHRMLRHRAGIQAIRLGFGISGLDPDEAERVPEYEIQAAKVEVPPVRMDDEQAAEELGAKYADHTEDDTPSAAEDPKPTGDLPDDGDEETGRKRRSRANKEQRRKFRTAIERGWVDEALVAPDLPDTEEEVEGKRPADDSIAAAFDIMWSDQAEWVLERVKAGKYKPPAPEADGTGDAEVEEAEDGPQAEPQQQSFEV